MNLWTWKRTEKKYVILIFLTCVIFMRLCVAHRRTILTNKRKVFERDEFYTWKRIGAQKKDVVLIFLSSVIFMRLCAAHRRTILTNKRKVFERDEFCMWKRIGAQKKDVILIFYHVSFLCVFFTQTHDFDK